MFTLPTEKELCRQNIRVCFFLKKFVDFLKKTLASPRSQYKCVYCFWSWGAPKAAKPISDEPLSWPVKAQAKSACRSFPFFMIKGFASARHQCVCWTDQWIRLENMTRIAGKNHAYLMFIVDGYLMVTSCYVSWKIYWANMSEPWGNHGFSPMKVMEIPGFPSTNPKTETPPGLEGRIVPVFLPGTTKTDSWYPIKSYDISDIFVFWGSRNRPKWSPESPVGQQHQRILWNVEKAHHHHTNTPKGKICDTCWFLKFPITSQYMRVPTSWGVYIYRYIAGSEMFNLHVFCSNSIKQAVLLCECVHIIESSVYFPAK